MTNASIFDKQQTIEHICARLAEGNSLRAICRELELAESTVRYWLSTDEEAFAQSTRAKELGCDALADECIDIADSCDDPADKRIKVETRIRLIGKWSQRYSDKVTVNSNATITHKYDFDNCDTAELEQLEATLAKASGSPSGASAS